MKAKYDYKVFEFLSDLVNFLRDRDIERKDIVAIIPVCNSKKIGLVYQEMSYDL